MNEIWKTFINEERKKEYFVPLESFINEERKTKTIYPEPQDVFNAFKFCDYFDLKVVIIGQDPYFTANTAHGLAFSSLQGYTPPSLQNVFEEIRNDAFPEFRGVHMDLFKSNNLLPWAKQGVLLLNTILTVEKDKPLSHKNKGWEHFTAEVIKKLNNHPTRLVYMLWGANAKVYMPLIDQTKHLVLQAGHPSPQNQAGGFLGCKHFSKANAWITKHYFNLKATINWSLL